MSKQSATALYASGLHQSEIGRRLGLSRQRIHQLIHGYNTIEFRDMVLEKDGHRCVYCGQEEGLNVHHIDGNSRNNQLFNLTTLCKKCHVDAHAGRIDVSSKSNLCPHCHGSLLRLSTPQDNKPL